MDDFGPASPRAQPSGERIATSKFVRSRMQLSMFTYRLGTLPLPYPFLFLYLLSAVPVLHEHGTIIKKKRRKNQNTFQKVCYLIALSQRKESCMCVILKIHLTERWCRHDWDWNRLWFRQLKYMMILNLQHTLSASIKVSL